METYDAYLVLNTSSSPKYAQVYWGDETNYTDTITNINYTDSNGNPDTHSLSTPGYHDTLAANNGGYDLTTTDQTLYHFAKGTSTAYYLASITSRSGYTLTINRATSAPYGVTSVTDAVGRTLLKFVYSSGLISTITDLIDRTWTMHYTGSDLTSITYPPVNGVSYSQSFTYNTSHDMTYHTDARGITSGPMTYNSNDAFTAGTDAQGNQISIAYNGTSTVTTDANGNSTTWNFAEGRLVSFTDPEQNSAYDSYDYDNNVTTYKDRRGYSTVSGFDTNGNGSSVVDPNSDQTSSSYNAFNDMVTSSAYLTGTGYLTTSYTWANNDGTNTLDGMHLTAVKDPLGNTTNYHYYPYPDPNKTTTTTRHDLLQNIVDPLTNTQAAYDYTFNGDGSYSATATNANSKTWKYSYSILGWLMNVTDPLSHETYYTYDNWGRLIATTFPDSTISQTCSRTWYDADSNVVAASDPNATVGTVLGGATWSSSNPFGTYASLAFDGSTGGVLLNNPLPTSSTSTGVGTLTGGSPAGGTGSEDEFGGIGRITIAAWIKPSDPYRTGTGNTAIQDIVVQSTASGPENFLRIYSGNYQVGSFDGTNVIAASIAVPSGETGTWVHLIGTYDGSKWTLYINGVAQATTTGSLAAQNVPAPWAIGSDSTNKIRFFSGNIAEVKLYNIALSSGQASALYKWNPYTGNPTSRGSNGLAHYWPLNEYSGSAVFDTCHTAYTSYDKDNRPLTVTNGRGDTVTYAYDGSDPRGNGRTQNGLLSSTTDGNGHVTQYGYSVRSEPEYTLYADNTSTLSAFDPDGNLSTYTDANGNQTSYVYDKGDRQTNTNYPTSPAAGIAATPSVQFFYDSVNRLKQTTEGGSANTYWFYDNDSRCTGASSPSLGGTSTTAGLSYGYDKDSHRTSISSAQGTWKYEYDTVNRLAFIDPPYNIPSKTVAGAYAGIIQTFNDDNTLNTRTAENGAVTTWSYDADDQVTGISTGNYATTVYGYDSGGDVSYQTKYAGYNHATPTTNFTYDGADQITSEAVATTSPEFPGAYAEFYTYDHNENRQSKVHNDYAGNVWTQNYTYGATDEMQQVVQFTASTSNTYTLNYDADGNTTAVSLNGAQQFGYGYDMENRLVAANSSGSGTDTYTYNAFGARTSVTNASGTLVQQNAGTSATSPLLYDGKTLYTPGVSEDTNGTYLSYEPDALGTTLGAEDVNNNQDATYEYDSFGVFAGGSGSLPGGNPMYTAFAGGVGYQSDTDTGLIRCGNRYYNPFFGRFLTQDPAGAGMNWYAYCDNDPTGELDPSGLSGSGVVTFTPTSSNKAATTQQGEDDLKASGNYDTATGGTFDVYTGSTYDGTFTIAPAGGDTSGAPGHTGVAGAGAGAGGVYVHNTPKSGGNPQSQEAGGIKMAQGAVLAGAGRGVKIATKATNKALAEAAAKEAATTLAEKAAAKTALKIITSFIEGADGGGLLWGGIGGYQFLYGIDHSDDSNGGPVPRDPSDDADPIMIGTHSYFTPNP